MNAHSSVYFQIPAFSIIVSSEADNRIQKRHDKKAKAVHNILSSGKSSDPGSNVLKPVIFKEG